MMPIVPLQPYRGRKKIAYYGIPAIFTARAAPVMSFAAFGTMKPRSSLFAARGRLGWRPCRASRRFSQAKTARAAASRGSAQEARHVPVGTRVFGWGLEVGHRGVGQSFHKGRRSVRLALRGLVLPGWRGTRRRRAGSSRRSRRSSSPSIACSPATASTPSTSTRRRSPSSRRAPPSAATRWRSRRIWVGIVGTFGKGMSPTRSCARQPMRW